MYEFLVWTILLGLVWLGAYFSSPVLRQKMRWSSLIALPFGFGELYFIPDYWMPQTLFDLGTKYRLDIESFVLMFFLGGIAAFVYEGVFKKMVRTRRRLCNRVCVCYSPLITALGVFVVLTRAFPDWNIIYPSSLACLAGGVVGMFFYPDMRKHILFGGFLFAALYWLSLVITEIFSPWIATTWNMAALSGILLAGVPVEELLFAFGFGALWAPLFEEVCSNVGSRGKNH